MILAGGAGERFWPASRAALPKPFLRVLGNRTLLDATAARARRVATRARVWVVCGAEHERPIRAAMRLPRGACSWSPSAATRPPRWRSRRTGSRPRIPTR